VRLFIPILALLLVGAAPTRISVRQLLSTTPTDAPVKLYGSQDGQSFVPVTLGAGLTQTLAGGVLTISAASGSAIAPVLGIVLKFDAEAGRGYFATVPAGNWQVAVHRNGVGQTATIDYTLALSATSLYIDPLMVEGVYWPSSDLVTVDLFPK
jgi:hypothetical protein